MQQRNTKSEMHYLVSEHILPEALVKTAKAKQLLKNGDVKTVHEAADQVGLSRSAFYKYKDGIHTLNRLDYERIVTISLDLQHRSGILSKVLSTIALHEGNVLTINQTIPLQGLANVVISVDIAVLKGSLAELIEALLGLDGVKRANVIGQG